MANDFEYVRQAAAIPLRNGRICLVTSSNGKRWVIPKGLIEPNQSAGECALQEAWEEAGLTGVLQQEPIGSYVYEKWCGVCHVMAPTLNGWHDRYSAQGVTVLGVTSDPVDVASRTAGELGMGYPLASDSSGHMLQAYRAYALPTLFVIDKQGNVRDVLIGYSTPRLREIEALVRKLIAEG